MGGSHFLRGERTQAYPGEIRARVHWRRYLDRVAVRMKRSTLSRRARASGLWRQQQRRYLRTGLSFADRLRPEAYLTLGESAGTQNFDSVMKSDVIFVIGANPTDGHPVFGSQMKRRLRQGAKLIVADPRTIDLVRTPHIEATHHLKLRPVRGTNVALLSSLCPCGCHRRVFVKREDFVREQLRELPAFEASGVTSSSLCRTIRLEAMESEPWNPASRRRSFAPLPASLPKAAIRQSTMDSGVTEHAQGSTAILSPGLPTSSNGHRQSGAARASA